MLLISLALMIVSRLTGAGPPQAPCPWVREKVATGTAEPSRRTTSHWTVSLVALLLVSRDR